MNMGYAEDYKTPDEEVNYHIIGVLLSQKFSLMYFLRKFINPGEKASAKELTQLHDMKTFVPLDSKKLTIEERLKALLSLMFLVEKRYGTIKDRTCYGLSKQRRGDI